MRHLCLSILMTALSAPLAHPEDDRSSLCYSEELFIFHASRASGANFSASEYRTYVESRSAEIVERYKDFRELKGIHDDYLEPSALESICGRMDEEEFRKLVLFIEFMEYGAEQALANEPVTPEP